METLVPTTKLSKPQCRALGIAILYSFDCKMLNSKNIAYTVLNDKSKAIHAGVKNTMTINEG